MTKEDIVAIAQEVGFSESEIDTCQLMLERFAALVASAERDRLTDFAIQAAEKAVDVAIALEREACAKVADIAVDFWVKGGFPECAEVREAMNIGESIRTRGQA